MFRKEYATATFTLRLHCRFALYLNKKHLIQLDNGRRSSLFTELRAIVKVKVNTSAHSNAILNTPHFESGSLMNTDISQYESYFRLGSVVVTIS